MEKMETVGLGCHSLLDLPLDLLILVLIRLPLKQLLKFLFVSKVLCSIIRQPKFIQAYRSRNPCLILSGNTSFLDKEGNLISFRGRFFGSNLAPSGCQVELFNLLNLSSGDSTNTNLGRIMKDGAITQIIDGFFCWYSRHFAVLVNLFTGEVTELPSPDTHCIARARYYFGFNPINGVYKLLCAEDVYYTMHYIHCQFHILTIGGSDRDSSWRKLPPSHCHYPARFNRQGISVNGALYWFAMDKNLDEYKILSFDLTTEKFRSFTPNANLGFLCIASLVKFRGRLSMLSNVDGNMIVHTLEMDDNNGYNWSIHEVRLPNEFQGGAFPIGNLPTRDILLAGVMSFGSVIPVYAYNHETNKFVRSVAGKFYLNLGLELQTEGATRLCAVEQNIEMLDALINRFSPKY